MNERTLILIKPDGVQRALIGKIVERYEARGLRIVGMKMAHADRALAERHYEVHREKPFFAGLVEFITSGPLIAMAVEGLNAVAVVREINGATRPHEAAPGSIRGDLALDTGHNLVHGSDSVESAQTELRLWFTVDELFEYSRELDHWVTGPSD
ncbi:MAG: nucleoside-diphosphate kinase, partial [Chloroflexota bacterium]